MVTLIKGCKSVKVVRDIQEVPAGCGSAVLTQTVAVHILVRVNPNSVSFNVI
jgi:valyl-tRNA synthetase